MLPSAENSGWDQRCVACQACNQSCVLKAAPCTACSAWKKACSFMDTHAAGPPQGTFVSHAVASCWLEYVVVHPSLDTQADNQHPDAWCHSILAKQDMIITHILWQNQFMWNYRLEILEQLAHIVTSLSNLSTESSNKWDCNVLLLRAYPMGHPRSEPQTKTAHASDQIPMPRTNTPRTNAPCLGAMCLGAMARNSHGPLQPKRHVLVPLCFGTLFLVIIVFIILSLSIVVAYYCLPITIYSPLY